MGQHFFFLFKDLWPFLFQTFLDVLTTISVAFSVVQSLWFSSCTSSSIPPAVLWIVVISSALDSLTECPGSFPISQSSLKLASQPRLPPFYSHLLSSFPPNREGTSHLLPHPSMPHFLMLSLVAFGLSANPIFPVATCPSLCLLRNQPKCHLAYHLYWDTQPPLRIILPLFFTKK